MWCSNTWKQKNLTLSSLKQQQQKNSIEDQQCQVRWNVLIIITPIHKTVDVILELCTCTRIDAPVSGTLEMREMCP